MARLMVAAAWCGAAALALAGCTGSDGREDRPFSSEIPTESPFVGRSEIRAAAPVAGSFEIRAVSAEARLFQLPDGAECAPEPLAPDEPGWVCDVATSTGYLVEPASIAAADVASVSAWANLQPGMTTWEVSVIFTAAGDTKFEALTRAADAAEAPADKVVMMVDGKVVSAPTVQNPIAGGEVVISALGGEAEAQALAAAIASTSAAQE